MWVATLGSHSALNILEGAQSEGFKTLLICERARTFYERFAIADEILYVDTLAEMGSRRIQDTLCERNAVVVPHGSFISYLDLDFIEHKFKPKIFGNRNVFRWESDRTLEREWLQDARLVMPALFSSPDEVDRKVIVKFFGAAGGAGYFISDDRREIEERTAGRQYQMQEFVPGVPIYFHYFYSPLTGELELSSIDKRYETNIDAIYRYSWEDPSFLVVGNIPVVVRESLLQEVFDMGEAVCASAKKLFGGLWGPFCLEAVITDKPEIVVFEISARIVAGTNPFIPYSPYSYLKHRRPMSAGRRIAVEIKRAEEEGRLEEVLS
jgi:5-formaminoimidazole-4-carboxamide-1-(beta)-D-ribofuranosyl 5'-monophosphate synthetase